MDDSEEDDDLSGYMRKKLRRSQVGDLGMARREVTEQSVEVGITRREVTEKQVEVGAKDRFNLSRLDGAEDCGVLLGDPVFLAQRDKARARAAPRYNQVLLSIIKDLPSFDRLVLFHDEDFVVIFDGFPKSRFHFLVMPLEGSPLCVDGVSNLIKLEKEIGGVQPALKKLHTLSQQFVAALEDRTKTRFVCGFHAVPSCLPLHYHVLSHDLRGVKMNSKEHWNSFTRRDFFVSAEVVLRAMQSGVELDMCTDKKKNVDQSLRCPTCEGELDSLAKMKEHRRHCRSLRQIFKL